MEGELTGPAGPSDALVSLFVMQSFFFIVFSAPH